MRFRVELAGSRHRFVFLAGAFALLICALLAITKRADADQIYWVNSNSVAYSQLDDTAGGYLPPSVLSIHGGSGTAIDTANGRIYVSQEATNQIAWFSLDGLTSGVVDTVAGTVDHPRNVSIDPATQTLYWANAGTPGSIGYAYVNESGGGILAHPGATVDDPTQIAVDMRHERIYWWNDGADVFSWATMSGLGGGNLVTPGLNPGVGQVTGIAIEPYSTPEELYFIDREEKGVFHTDPVLGGEPEEIQESFSESESRPNAIAPVGLAFDLAGNRFYWANSGVVEDPEKAIGTATVFGRPATIKTFPEAPIHNPGFPAVLKEPASTSEPQITLSGTTLSCTQGEWEGDHPGASVFAAPTSIGIQWRKSSTAIPGATGGSFTATETGSYSCEAVAENAAGTTRKASKSVSISFPKAATTPATTKPKTSSSTSTTTLSAKLASTKPVKVKAGGTATIKVDLGNSGKAAAASTKLCGTLTKAAKKGLKAPACVTVKSVAAGKTVVAGLKVKTLGSAHGTYKLTVVVSGAAQASLAAKVQVARAKR